MKNFFRSLFHWKFFLHSTIILALFVGLLFGLSFFLDNYTKHDEKIKVPDVSKMNIFDAVAALENAGLKCEVDSFKYSPEYKPFQILDIYPKVGSEVKTGRRIFIRANPRTWRPVELPNLVDRSQYLAFNQLERIGLVVGDTIFEKYKYPDVVIRMLYKNKIMKPGDTVPRFSKIDLVIGKPLDKNVTMPSLLGMTYTQAKKFLAQNFYELGISQFLFAKDSANARVYYQSPLPGDLSDQGMPVDIWLSSKPDDDEAIVRDVARLNGKYNKAIRIDSTGRLNVAIELDKYEPKPDLKESSNTQGSTKTNTTKKSISTTTKKPSSPTTTAPKNP